MIEPSQFRLMQRRVYSFALAGAMALLAALAVGDAEAFTLIPRTTLSVVPNHGVAAASFTVVGQSIFGACPAAGTLTLIYKFYWDKTAASSPIWTKTVSTCTVIPGYFYYDTGKSPPLLPPSGQASIGSHTIEVDVSMATGAPFGTAVAVYSIDAPPPPPPPPPPPVPTPIPTPTPRCTVEGPAHGCIPVDCAHLTASLPAVPPGMPSLLLGLLLGGGSAALVLGPGIRRRYGRRSRIAALLGLGGLVLMTTGCAVPAATQTVASPTAVVTIAIAGFEATPDCRGYWLVAGDGGIFPFGSAAGLGSTGAVHLNKPIVGMDATPGGGGYWLVAGDGGIFPFGDAVGYGSTASGNLNKPIVAMESSVDGHGYWLVASDGGIFPFGDAGGYGSTGAIRLNKPIVDLEATPDGGGYWLVASDGGIFPFGDAHGFGSTGATHLNKPIVGMEATPDGGGYWLVASDGGIFPFGDATGYGSTGGIHLNKPIVGMEETADGHGYWLFAGDGGVFPFGDAGGYGSPHLGA